MKVLSIDVGIKNLAYCLFEKSDISDYYSIKKWNSINVSEKITSTCCAIEKNNICNKPAVYTKEEKCFCLKHSKKQHFLIPTNELKMKFIHKRKIQELYDIADKYKISYSKPIKKIDLVEIINEYINKTCFDTVTNVNASKIDIVTIGENIKYKFDILFSEEDKINHIIIENQISPIANRMKTIQGLITQYFIMKGNYDNIEFISAANKLKETNINTNMDNEKKENTYSNRKKMGISKCVDYLTNDYAFQPMFDYFNKHTKKDDLADSFLQGIWFINNKLNK
jgi:hypothetical protein